LPCRSLTVSVRGRGRQKAQREGQFLHQIGTERLEVPSLIPTSGHRAGGGQNVACDPPLRHFAAQVLKGVVTAPNSAWTVLAAICHNLLHAPAPATGVGTGHGCHKAVGTGVLCMSRGEERTGRSRA
jgi:hypothetical protein